MRTPGTSSRTAAIAAVVTVCCLLALVACSNASDGDSSASDAAASGDGGGRDDNGGGSAAQNVAPEPGIADSAGAGDRAAASVPGQAGSAQKSAPDQPDLLSDEALVKTGSVAVRSADIGHALTRVYGIVGGVGGDISKEDTSTNAKGEETRSLLVLRVPVDEFDSTLDQVAGLGQLVSKVRSSKDVTTAVADIDSRVRSAQRSIATLRQLFGKADKLGDIIRLESELAQREADLESLQAQQRALNDKTTMSTITMTLELPPVPVKPTPKADDDKAGGFVSGIRQGWDALKAATVAVGHGLGLVLPIGVALLLLSAIAAWCVRRWAPHHEPASKQA